MTPGDMLLLRSMVGITLLLMAFCTGYGVGAIVLWVRLEKETRKREQAILKARRTLELTKEEETWLKKQLGD